jgi:site-specific DNA-methyltransferase (adenine-specific)
LAIALIEKRLKMEFPNQVRPYEVHGIPTTVSAARKLAETDRFEFQDWIIEYGLGGVSNPTKVGDGGYDGYITFKHGKEIDTVLIEVKSGKINHPMLARLIQTVNFRKASMGAFVTLQPPTKGMIEAANNEGFYRPELYGNLYHKIVILTVEDILNGKTIPHPETEITTFKSAKPVKKKSDQIGLELE